MDTEDNQQPEPAIEACVRQFYGAARQDPVLGPVFEASVHDWESHFKVITNFWSSALLGTGTYKGSPFSVHRNLPVELEHFELWLALFEKTAHATLPADLAARAVAKAQHMAISFKAGIFPFVDAEGKPSRHPG